jgi:predicted O-methyltransferase YrrM
MAHHGYIPFALEFLSLFDNPKILEIGVDRGQTTFPIIHHLMMMKKKFTMDSIDVLIRDEVKVIATYFGLNENQRLNLIQGNSLDFLPQTDSKYQLIFLDGDHNYYTVSRELELLSTNNVLRNSIIIIDDYHGRWSNKDLFYSTKSEYDEVSGCTKPVETEKHGVAPAVDDFCSKYPEWKKKVLMQGEPIVLYRENNDGF